ncbi:MAG: GTP-binding protein [Bacteroidetes bacterium HGW-Bacteroidetes-6]|nr:MAG: GTP-binding protein [Bacteroidetes bacterium HGW-Bacteroidetes-6]
MKMLTDKRNIAFFAHADAGKTSLTEQILHISGRIKQPGSVDAGTTHTDFLPVEKERGISVCSSHTNFEWNGVRINLVDTPGHVDFSADVERIMNAIDGAILVISAAEGLQAHTLHLWNALKSRNIPVLIFVNKIDRSGADVENLLIEIKREWKQEPLCLQAVADEGSPGVQIRSIWRNELQSESITELVVADNETMLDQFLSGIEIPFNDLCSQLAEMVAKRKAFPVIFGSAKFSIGIEELLDSIVNYLPSPYGSPERSLSAVVFGVSFDKTMGKVAHVRIVDGSISNRESIRITSKNQEEKVIQIRQLSGGKFEEIQKAEAGDIVGVCGLSIVEVGDILGQEGSFEYRRDGSMVPLLTVRAKPVNDKDYFALAEALTQLSVEDPMLQFEWNREDGEMNVSVMGWIQMEVLERILFDRFGVAAVFENPTKIYKETPMSSAEGYARYWMPKPCWAIVKFKIEPGVPGSGVVYSSEVSVNSIAQKYQNEVERTIASSLKQGIKGWEVTDLRITLVEGEDHEIHSRPGDFTIATPMAIMNGLVNCGTVLLEPIFSFQIRAVEELLGSVTSDITKMRGSFETPEIEDGKFVLRGLLPVATSQDYSVKLSSRSGGKAGISTQFFGYQPCLDELGVIRPYRGISPLDEAKWILKARGAIQ